MDDHTWGMTPISRRRGPKMNPPPDPSSPPTVPPNIPHNAQKASWIGVHSSVASHTDSVFPEILLLLVSLYNFTHSIPKTPRATGNWEKKKRKALRFWPLNSRKSNKTAARKTVSQAVLTRLQVPVSKRAANTMCYKPLHHSAKPE